MKAPFPWFGGKRRVAPLIWSAFGDVAHYIEPFAGSLAVLLDRPAWHKARSETVNDADCFLGTSAGGGVNDTNRTLERIWFSPHCLTSLGQTRTVRR